MKVEQMLTFADKLSVDMRKPTRPPVRRRRPTQRRAQEAIQAILDAVIRLLKRRGASAITTNSIAATAGVSIGSVYQYFPNKQAIFIALHERHIHQVDEVLQRKIDESEGETLDHLVTALLDGMIEMHESDSELAGLLDSKVPHRNGGAREFSIRLHDPIRKALAHHAESLGGTATLHIRAFLLGNLLESLGHAVVLRRPHTLSLLNAKIEAGRAILACLRS